MDAPPEHEDSRPFLAIAAHLRGLGFSAPDVLAKDMDKGLILLEDFGYARVNPLLEREPGLRSEEHTSELQSLMRISYAVFCLQKNSHTPRRLTKSERDRANF